MYTYPYPRMLVTVDAVVFLLDSTNTPTHVLLVERGHEPFKGRFALPGGFPELHERLADAAARELFEETGIGGISLHQIGAFDEVDRDPRDRNISIAFWGTTHDLSLKPAAGDDAAMADWFPLEKLPLLAFDHTKIVEAALGCLNKSL